MRLVRLFAVTAITILGVRAYAQDSLKTIILESCTREHQFTRPSLTEKRHNFWSDNIVPGSLAIEFSGEMRIRHEVDGRDFSQKTPLMMYTLMRTRAGAKVSLASGITGFVLVQDSRILGEEKSGPLYSTPAQSYSTQGNIKSMNNASLDLHQAYIGVDSFLTDMLSLKAGRFEVSYGSQRIISVSNWNNIGRVFDGILFRFSFTGGFLDFFLFNTGEVNAVTSVSPANVSFIRDSGQTVIGGYFSKKIFSTVTCDVHYVFQRDANLIRKDTVALLRSTVGALVKGNVDEVLFEGETSLQFGQKSGLPVNAYYIALSAGISPSSRWVQSVSIHSDLLSGRKEGESDARNSAMKSYELVFPSNHAYFGYADYFKSGMRPQYDRGISDLYLRLVVTPAENVTLKYVLHNFTLQNPLLISPGKSSSELGQEADVIAVWKYSKHLSFEAGVVGYVPGEVARDKYSGSDTGVWSYLTMQLNF